VEPRPAAADKSQVLFLRRLLVDRSAQPAHQPLNQDQRSYLVTLPFPDLRPHVDILPTLAVGASAVELRADLLFDPDPVRASSSAPEAYENPSLSYISEQMALLRRHLPDVPVVFTLRTPEQGGKYPFPADAPAKALFATMHHALKLGAEYVDVEQGLESASSQVLIKDAKERGANVIVSWRDTRAPHAGGFAWDGEQAYAHYSRAVAAGADIVKMVGTAGEVADNFALRIFAAARERESATPLAAYNMGERGRISRFLNPLLASVTHPLAKELTRRGTVGSPSMTFRETQQALHLSGLLKVRHFYVGAPAPFVAWAEELGLPHHFHVLPDEAFLTVEALQQATLRHSEPLGHGLCIPHALKNPVPLSRRSREAAAIDAVDTVHAVARGEALEWVGA
jgi:pentafunctional AROM polypeptide